MQMTDEAWKSFCLARRSPLLEREITEYPDERKFPQNDILVQHIVEAGHMYHSDVDLVKEYCAERVLEIRGAEAGVKAGTFVDEDGFILVGAPPSAKSQRSVGSVTKLLSRLNADGSATTADPKRPGVLRDFYKFQLREAREKEFVSLKRAFASDEAAVESMKRRKRVFRA